MRPIELRNERAWCCISQSLQCALQAGPVRSVPADCQRRGGLRDVAAPCAASACPAASGPPAEARRVAEMKAEYEPALARDGLAPRELRRGDTEGDDDAAMTRPLALGGRLAPPAPPPRKCAAQASAEARLVVRFAADAAVDADKRAEASERGGGGSPPRQPRRRSAAAFRRAVVACAAATACTIAAWRSLDGSAGEAPSEGRPSAATLLRAAGAECAARAAASSACSAPTAQITALE
jgi:hypothetical protein